MIEQNVRRILNELPEGVRLVAAAKTRSPEEILRAIEAGIKIVGENYVQEAFSAFTAVGQVVEWHFIGHLQRNKVKKAVEIFDMIETVDSIELAREIDMRASRIGKKMAVLLEVNSGREARKFGVHPENVEALVRGIVELESIQIQGLMTMGPLFGDPELARPYFRSTSEIYRALQNLRISGVKMNILSMGMTNSWRVAIEEGANMIRIGTMIFGPR